MISKNNASEASQDIAREVTDDGIVHFDATAKRRREMKSHSLGHAAGHMPTAQATRINEELLAKQPNNVQAHLPASNSTIPITSLASSNELDMAKWKSRVQSYNTSGTMKVDQPTSPIGTSETSQPKIAETALPVSMQVTVTTQAKTSQEANVNAKARGSIQDYERFLVGFVVEQTGYPEDVVELDADLEADLGIDSIKIAQMIGELYEHFSVDWKSIKAQSMEEFKTLRNIIDVLVETMHQNSGMDCDSPTTTSNFDTAQPTSPPGQNSHQAAPSQDAIRAEMTKFLVQFVVEQTGYPEDVVELDADLEADLGIDSIKIAQMMGELNEYFGLNVAVLTQRSADDFKTLRAIVDTVLEAGVSSEAARGFTDSPSQSAATSDFSSVSSGSTTTLLDPVTSSLAQTSSHPARSPEAMKHFLVQFVVEQTGYPEDVVELDADLEADLGIDSIKIAQMFGELNEYFQIDIRKFTGRSMEDFKTLRSMIDFLAENES